jgi:hypothetical protein
MECFNLAYLQLDDMLFIHVPGEVQLNVKLWNFIANAQMS